MDNTTRKWDYDVIIVGAGIAGSALSHALGKLGRKVLTLERDLKEPNRIVGELMQPGGVLKLRELGLEDCLEGIDGIEVQGYGVIYGKESVRLTYPLYEGTVVKGKSFHHGRFVQKLRAAARTVSNVTMIEATATRLLEDGQGVCGVAYKEGDQQKETYAPLTVVCDGCFSNFRKNLNIPKPSIRSHFVGVILVGAKLPHQYCGNVFLANPGPILAYQIGSDEVRILVDIPDPLPSSGNGELAEYLKSVTGPQLPEQLRDAFFAAVNEGKIRSMPNSLLHPSEDNIKPGLLALGDTWNMRHPLTGGGMTVALSDVCCLTQLIREAKGINFENRKEVVRTLMPFYHNRKPLAVTINILACALHSVFSASEGEQQAEKIEKTKSTNVTFVDPVLPYMRQACFDYFKLGGACVEGPMSLLSALNPKPHVLLTHFFLVGLYGALQSLWPPKPSNIIRSYKIMKAASWIVIPLMRGEKVFFLFRTMLLVLFFRSSKRE